MKINLSAVTHYIKLHWLLCLALLLVLVGGGFAWRHYHTNPDKIRLTAQAPTVSSEQTEDDTAYENSSDPRATLAFGQLKIEIERPTTQQKAPLFRQEVLQSSQLLNSLIRITPQVRGTWQVGPSQDSLTFQPQTPWLPAKKYEVHISPKLFSSHVKLSNKKVVFTTLPNQVTIDEFFSLPGTQKKHLSLSGKIHFDYEVEPNVTQGVVLTLDNKTLASQVSLDKNGRVLHVKYENIALTNQDQQATLQVKWGKMAAKSHLTLEAAGKFFNLKEVKVLPPARIGQPYTLAAEFTDLVNAQKLLADKKVKIWLLPLNKKQNWAAQRVEAVRKELDKATEITLKAIPGVSSVASFQIATNLKTRNQNRYVFVEFLPGITSEGEFISEQSKAFVLPVAKYPKRLKIVGSGSVLSLKKEPFLQFVSQGIDKVQVQVSRVRRADINHLVSQIKGDISKPCFGYIDYTNYYDDNDETTDTEGEYSCFGYSSFNEYDIAEVFRKTIPLADTETKPNFFTLDLSQYLKQNSSGLFIVEASDEHEEASQRRLILVSDIGLMYKKEEKGLKVFALELSSQQPLAQAKVDLLARNGTLVKTRYTNEQGVTDFELPSQMNPEKEPVALLVSKGEDYSFIPVGNSNREVIYNRFNVNGEDAYQQQNNLDVLLFTDRGIYRPGEQIHFALVAKNKRWSSTAGLPIQLRIEDPRGKTVFDKKVSLSATGLSDFTYTTEPSSATGEYQIRVYHEDKQYISGTSFEVKEFQEDKLKVKATWQSPHNKGWQPLEGLKAKVDVQNLFGAPAVNNPVNIKVQLQPASFTFDRYSDYTFRDPVSRPGTVKTETMTFESLTTSDFGEVEQPIDLSSYDKGTYKLVLRAEAFEQESGHSVSAQDTLMVSSQPYVVGYKTQADLSYLQQHARSPVDFIALAPNLNHIGLTDSTTHLFSRQYVSVPARSNHSSRYQSVLQETPLSTKPFVLKKEGSSYALPTQSPGMYALEIHNSGDEKVMRIEFAVSGNANISYNMERSAELRLNLEKDTVSRAQTLHFNITAPYTGIGLITVEKEKVYAYKWFKTDTTSSVQSITLPDDLVGSAYLNVSFLRSMDSKEILLNPHSYATVPFYVIPSQHMAQITLKTPPLVKPADTLQITYATSTPSQIILYGVNEGILQVARYKLPNPLSYFFPKQRLGVRTYQMWDLVMADPRILKEVYGIGGDQDFDASLAALGLNPFARKSEKPVAFWSGILEASPTPKTYSYQVPDYFNGKIRVMAVAVSNQTVASTQQEVLVRAPLVISAGGPVAVAPGDTFEVSAKVSNQYEQTGDPHVHVRVKTSPNLQVLDPAPKTANIPYQKEATVSFQIKALEQLGNANITFEADLAESDITAKREITLSVRPASAYRVSINTGNGKGNFTIKQFEKRNLYVPFSKRQIAISPNPLVVALGLGSYLEKFPHGCTEQIVSQVFPTIVFYASTGDKRAALDAFEETHKKLQARQQPDGGFALWDTGTQTNAYASLYAFHLLTEA
ncbi:MAG: MG2 domain-containing protein, partial [Elusimicrobiaceae bacterium]|nr:MG2 domain-containing protein [Elusimicrobiaceae bacterium]